MFNPSPIEGHLGRFQFGAVYYEQSCYEHYTHSCTGFCVNIKSSFLCEKCPVVLLLGHMVQADLRDIAGLVPDHHNEENSTIKPVTQTFWFPSTYKSYVYTIL